MSLFQVDHPNSSPSVVRAASLVVFDGFLHALRYSGGYEPGKTECEASWAPGQWTTYRRAETCPKCGKEQNKFELE